MRFKLDENVSSRCAWLLAESGQDLETVAPGEADAIQAGIVSLEQDGGKPMEDVLADFGLTIKFPQDG